MSPPLATYRLQMGGEMDFARAAELAPYLVELGVSHLYLSPIFQATPGSSHGYDVVDPTRPSEELGGAEGFARLCQRCKELGLGLVLDVVPNHMAVHAANPWWWDLLEHGRHGRWAGFFDVEWDPPEERMRDLVLLPVLGDHIGRELGSLAVHRQEERLVVSYHEHRFPLSPETTGRLLAEALPGDDRLGFVADALAMLPNGEDLVDRRYRYLEVARQLLSELLADDPGRAAAIDQHLDDLSNDPDRLLEVLDAQHYRLARWRVAAHELGYRRFFDIDQMVALRSERPEVFEASHRLALQMVEDGCVQGLRIDHIDGLRRPGTYLERLAEAAPAAWVVVEKILEHGESLPEWPVAGTTGYEVAALLLRLLMDPGGEAALSKTYQEVLGEEPTWEEVWWQAKVDALNSLLGADVARIAQILVDICEQRPRHRDYSRAELADAVQTLLAAFPVYRSYVDPIEGSLSEADVAAITAAAATALQRRPDLDPELVELVTSILLLDTRGESEAEFVYRFQQVSGPAMAKGVEDTAFYRYVRFVALNEVGADPAVFAASPQEFHDACAAAATDWPRRMTSTSTHDTKRSEDVRARLAVLSEAPDLWRTAVMRWRERHVASDLDPADIYAFYQNVVGVWPVTVERMTTYMEKATREAKLHTSWRRPDPDYDAAVARFVQEAFADRRFVAEVEELVAEISPAGQRNALAQKLLCLTVPGIPDLYQGTELWNHTLVDPDNRAPVDFGRRRELLGSSPPAAGGWDGEGLAKLWVVRRALEVRRRHPAAFAGSYRPLQSNPADDRVVGFLRGEMVAVVVPRLTFRSWGEWGTTTVLLPPGRWHHQLVDHAPIEGQVRLDELFSAFPVALLAREGA